MSDASYEAAQEMWDRAVPDEPYQDAPGSDYQDDDEAREDRAPEVFPRDDVIELEVIDRFDRVIDHLTIKARP